MTMAEIVKYRAKFNWEKCNDGDINIKVGDILCVAVKESQLASFIGTLEEPKGWLLGRNETTKQSGTFPGTYVEFVEKIEPSQHHLPPRGPGREKPTPVQRRQRGNMAMATA